VQFENSRKAPIKLLNLSQFPVEIPKNTPLAEVHKAIYESKPTQIKHVHQVKPSYASREKDPLYSELHLGHLEESVRNKLLDLIFEYRSVFSAKSDPIGRRPTDFVTHEINLTSNVPFRRPQYTIPAAYKPLVKAELDRLHKLNIIEPSNSPYSSSLIAIVKRLGPDKYIKLDWSQIIVI